MIINNYYRFAILKENTGQPQKKLLGTPPFPHKSTVISSWLTKKYFKICGIFRYQQLIKKALAYLCSC